MRKKHMAAVVGAALMTVVPATAAATPLTGVAAKGGAVDLRVLKPKAKDVAALRRKLRDRDDRIPVFVVLRARWTSEALLDKDERLEQRRSLARLGTSAVKGLARHARLRRASEGIPVFSMEVDRKALASLAADPAVAAIESVPTFYPHDTASSATTVFNTAQRIGATGAGWTIAVIDTGVEADHRYFGGRVLPGACFSVAKKCSNGASRQTGGTAGEPCTFSTRCDHGTHVAGIAAGAGDWVGNGVAPSANILPVMASSPDVNGRTSFPADDYAEAMKWVADQARTRKIAAVNSSLGGGKFEGGCAEETVALQVHIKNLRDAGVALVASSGNSGYKSAIGHPACLPGVVAVGNTLQDDTVASDSNASAELDLWAPGSDIQSATIANAFIDKSGTSMAAPQVAGAFALLRQLAPDPAAVTPDTLLGLLRSSGVQVTDKRTGGTVTAPRLNVYGAIMQLHAKKLRTGSFAPQPAPLTIDSDFDADGRKDLLLWRPSNRTFYSMDPDTDGFGKPVALGGPDAVPVPGRYLKGDARTDLAVFTPATGRWMIVDGEAPDAGALGVDFGQAGDWPVPADYDGDGTTDVAVWRPSNGTWHWKRSGDGTFAPGIPFGTVGDVPVPGYYDADAKVDIAVWRPSNGTWYWKNSTDGTFAAPVPFGQASDIPAPADWDADGRTDVGVFRLTDRKRYTRGTVSGLDGTPRQITAGMLPGVHGDYDGDKTIETGVTSVATDSAGVRKWLWTDWTSGSESRDFGVGSDVPLR